MVSHLPVSCFDGVSFTVSHFDGVSWCLIHCLTFCSDSNIDRLFRSIDSSDQSHVDRLLRTAIDRLLSHGKARLISR
jgi:hypothetical protein